jgi:hypothetical protein
MKRVNCIVETTCREVAGQSFKLYVEWKQFHKEKNFKPFGSTTSKLHVRMFHFIMQCLRKAHNMKLWLGSSVHLQVFPSHCIPVSSYVIWMMWMKFSSGGSRFEDIVLATFRVVLTAERISFRSLTTKCKLYLTWIWNQNLWTQNIEIYACHKLISLPVLKACRR